MIRKSLWISLSVILLSILVSGSQVVMAAVDHDPTPQVQYYNPPHKRWADPDNISIGINLLPEDKSTFRVYKQAIKAWNKTGVVHLKYDPDDNMPDIECDAQSFVAVHKIDPEGTSTRDLGVTQGRTRDGDPGYKGSNLLESEDVIIDPTGIKKCAKRNHMNYKKLELHVAEHEIGHALGLDHVGQHDHSVMRPVADKSILITKEDTQHLRELYSNPVKIDVPDVYTHR